MKITGPGERVRGVLQPLGTHCPGIKAASNCLGEKYSAQPCRKRGWSKEREPRVWKHAEKKEKASSSQSPQPHQTPDVIRWGTHKANVFLGYLKTSPACLVTHNCSGVQSSSHCEHTLKDMTPISIYLKKSYRTAKEENMGTVAKSKSSQG